MHLLIDSHVHFHSCFDFNRFVEGALTNFRSAIKKCPSVGKWAGFLLLADCENQDTLSELETRSVDLDGWHFEKSDEEESRILIQEDIRIVLAAGQQIVTKEGLELLALGSRKRFPARLPILDLLTQVQEAGAIPVIPWGFGKWTFRRRKVVADLLIAESPNGRRFFLGDNGGRASSLPSPSLFRKAHERKIALLPGSDPLPMKSHNCRAGSYGFVMDGQIDQNRPVESLKILLNNEASITSYGRLSNLWMFCWNQAFMQAIKRAR